MSTDALSHTFSALSDPTRRAILAKLVKDGPCSVNDLAAPFAMSLPAVSKHLRVLEKSGLISRSRNKQWRPCQLSHEPLKQIDVWLKDYRKLWDPRREELEHQLELLAAKLRNA